MRKKYDLKEVDYKLRNLIKLSTLESCVRYLYKSDNPKRVLIHWKNNSNALLEISLHKPFILFFITEGSI